jgi:hypothetical protein
VRFVQGLAVFPAQDGRVKAREAIVDPLVAVECLKAGERPVASRAVEA